MRSVRFGRAVLLGTVGGMFCVAWASAGEIYVSKADNDGVQAITAGGWQIASQYTLYYTPPGGSPISFKSGTINYGGAFGDVTVPKTAPKGSIISATGLEYGADKNSTAYATQLVQATASNSPGMSIASPVKLYKMSSVSVLGGSPLPVTGNFVLLNEKYDLDPSSPNFGLLAGELLGDSVSISAGGNTINLIGNISWSMNTSALLTELYDGTMTSPVAVDIPFTTFSTTVVINGTPLAATGNFSGTDQFALGDINQLSLTLNFETADGPISAQLSGAENAPEPSTWVMLGIGFAGLSAAGAWARNHPLRVRKSHEHCCSQPTI